MEGPPPANLSGFEKGAQTRIVSEWHCQDALELPRHQNDMQNPMRQKEYLSWVKIKNKEKNLKS